MATSVMRNCECGMPYLIYLPKVTFCKWWLNEGTGYGIEYFQEIDREEMEAGEVDTAKDLAKSFGWPFVDSREVEKFSCLNCQREIRVSDVLKELKNLVMGGGQSMTSRLQDSKEQPGDDSVFTWESLKTTS
jgi:hypothetical protein